MKRTILLIFFISSITSCSTPKILRYYKSSDENVVNISTKEEINKYLTVNAFVLDPNVGLGKTIFDLSDKGQSSLIESLNAKTKTPKELYSALAMPIKGTVGSVSGVKGSLLWKKTIVLNIMKANKDEASRVQQVLFTLEIPSVYQDKVEFVSWDKIKTEIETVDIGKVTEGSSTTLSFSPEITLAGTIKGKAPGGASNTKTFNEEKTFTGKLASLNAALVSKSKFQVLRQTIPNENIGGNIVVELTLRSKLAKEITIYDFNGFYSGSTIISDPSKIGLVKTTLVMPDFGSNSNEVPINLTYDFRYRQVSRNKRTSPEYDDRISYIDGKLTEDAKFKLFDEEDSKTTKTWEISNGTNSLHLVKIGYSPELLMFDSSTSAGQLLSWIKQTRMLSVSDYQLFIGTSAMAIKDISSLNVVVSR